MTGQQSKSGISYEILVAASLSIYPHKDEGISLDLTSFDFNVNPRTFNDKMTSIGFDVTPDIEVRQGDLTYIVECKSSTVPGEVLKIGSDAFLGTILEFSAIENFRQNSQWNLRYVMVVEYQIGKDIRNLFEGSSQADIEGLLKRLKKYGRNEHPSGFNEELLTSQLVMSTISRCMLVIQGSQYLETRYSENPDFRKKCEGYLTQMRYPPSESITKKHRIISQGAGEITFCCEAESHEECHESAMGDLIFHIGNIESFTKRLVEIFPSSAGTYHLVRLSELEGISNKVAAPENVSQKYIAEVVGNILTKHIQKIDKALLVLIVPGTYDLLIGNHKLIEDIIKKTHSFVDNKYNLDRIPEFRGLGSMVKISLARQVLKLYDFETTDNDFTADEEYDEY